MKKEPDRKPEAEKGRRDRELEAVYRMTRRSAEKAPGRTRDRKG